MEKIAGNSPDLRALFPATISTVSRVRLSLWDMPESLAQHVSTLSPEKAWGDSSHWKNGNEKFSGVKSMNAAIKLCRDGWPDGANRAARLRDKIAAAHPIQRKLASWGVAGAYPSVARALAGNPLAMRQFDNRESRRRPVLTLVSDFACNAGVGGNAITNRAAVVAAIVDSVEASGFACHVVAFEASRGGDCVQLCAATVKESDQSADIGRLAFALGHAAMFRRLCWATITEDSWIEGLGYGLGTALALDFTSVPDVYCLPSANTSESYFRSEDIAATQGLDFLVESLRKQGCPAFPQRDAA